MKKKAATTIVATAAAPDLPLALCRRLQRRGWAVVHRPSGQVVAHGSTRARAALVRPTSMACRAPSGRVP